MSLWASAFGYKLGGMQKELSGGVTLVLSMIVKNESKVIDRCLDAALPLVDAYVIVDTGSEDDTRLRIIEAGKRHDRPGGVFSDDWKDFGHNRSRAAALTKEYAKQKGFDLGRTYMLLLDADMILGSQNLDRKELTLPSYELEQRDAVLSWFNMRLCRLDHEWQAVGVTHEYWRAIPDAPPARLRSLWIEDRGDGGAKGNKAERDVLLLRQGLKDEPQNFRYMFYLAQTLFDCGRFDEAIPLYEQRRTFGGFEEERWYSLYKIGLCHLRMANSLSRPHLPTAPDNPIALGTDALLRAYQERPHRAEPLVVLAQHYRTWSKNHIALMFARQAKRIPMPSDALFVEKPAHSYQPLEEIAITAYYTGDKEEGRRAAEDILASRVDFAVHAQAARCVSFYASPLSRCALRMGVFSVPLAVRAKEDKFLGLEEPNTTEYLAKNPTLVELDGEVFVHVSLVNYHHERGVIFAPKDSDRIVRTRGVVLSWDPETNETKSAVEPAWEMPDGWKPDVAVRGLEDQRWAVCNGRVWFTSTCFHVTGQPQVVLGRTGFGFSGITRLLALKYEHAFSCEKNWVPFSWNGGLYVIYSYDPVVVLEVDTETGAATEVSRKKSPRSASSFRGGTSPINTPWGMLLTIIHEVAHFPDRRVYMHRFVELSLDFEMLRCSKLFVFETAGVEYATGMLARAKTDAVIITYGFDEREARWMEIGWDDISRLMEGLT